MEQLLVAGGLALALCVALAVLLILKSRLNAARLEAQRLQDSLAGRDAAVDERDGRLADLEGRLAGSEAERAAAVAESGRLAALLDSLPQPVWLRDAELRVVYANRAYRAAVGNERDVRERDARERDARERDARERDARERERDAPAAGALELFEGGDLGEEQRLARRVLAEQGSDRARLHAVIAGERRLLEVTKSHIAGQGVAGTARDLTDWEEMKGELARHVEAEREVLEKLGVAIAILSGDLHVRFYNTAYLRLWKLDENFLAGQPEMGEVLDRLREQRRLPEQVDFAEFKRQYLRRFQTLIEPFEELEHLPDGTTVRVSMHPHPFGGVLITYEDVTDTLKLERTYNTLLEVQRATLDNLYEGVAVYGADGRLKLSNPAFQRIWNLPESLLSREPHVRDLVVAARDFYDVDDAQWPVYLERLVGRVTEPEPRTGRRERADGSVIDFALVPLPDGAC